MILVSTRPQFAGSITLSGQKAPKVYPALNATYYEHGGGGQSEQKCSHRAAFIHLAADPELICSKLHAFCPQRRMEWVMTERRK